MIQRYSLRSGGKNPCKWDRRQMSIKRKVLHQVKFRSVTFSFWQLPHPFLVANWVEQGAWATDWDMPFWVRLPGTKTHTTSKSCISMKLRDWWENLPITNTAGDRLKSGRCRSVGMYDNSPFSPENRLHKLSLHTAYYEPYLHVLIDSDF